MNEKREVGNVTIVGEERVLGGLEIVVDYVNNTFDITPGVAEVEFGESTAHLQVSRKEEDIQLVDGVTNDVWLYGSGPLESWLGVGTDGIPPDNPHILLASIDLHADTITLHNRTPGV